MSIQRAMAELNKTAEYLRRTRKAILGRGGEISETAGLKDLPDAIINIPADTSLAFQTDEETAYEKVVPSGAEEYALLKSVGGMTYKCKNLFDVSKEYTPDKHFNPATGVYEAWGSSWAVTDYISVRENTQYAVNESFGITGASPHYCIVFFDVEKNQIGFVKDAIFTTPSGCAYIRSNLVIAKKDTAMLNEGSTALPYEPYFEGLRHTKVTAFESEGANLIPFPYNGGGVGTVRTHNGITFTVNEDRSIHISGKLTTTLAYFGLTNMDFGAVPISAIEKEQATNGEYSASKRLYYNAANKVLTINITDVDTEFDEVLYPMVNRGSSLAPYKPYSAEPIDTYTIPEAVQSLEGYGLGINAEYNNHIEFVNGRVLYHKVCETILLNGSESWVGVANSRFYISDADSSLKKPVIADVGISDEWSLVPYSNISTSPIGSFCVRQGGGIQVIASFDNLGSFREKLMSNPVTIIYAVAEPIIIDITAFLTNERFVRVEGGGVIRAVNEHKQDAPSTIKYTVKVGN